MKRTYVIEDQYAERTQTRELLRKPIVGFQNYSIEFFSNNNPAEYERLYNKLKELKSYHIIEVPNVFKQKMYVSSLSDTLTIINDNIPIYDNLTCNFLSADPTDRA